jgi:hypothetical protein
MNMMVGHKPGPRPAWLIEMMREHADKIRRHQRRQKIATMRARADMIERSFQTRTYTGAWSRAASAVVSLRLLASLAENHQGPPPDCEDSLSDMSPYNWQRVAAERMFERHSICGSQAWLLACENVRNAD